MVRIPLVVHKGTAGGAYTTGGTQRYCRFVLVVQMTRQTRQMYNKIIKCKYIINIQSKSYGLLLFPLMFCSYVFAKGSISMTSSFHCSPLAMAFSTTCV